jgi:hypothetical protein
MGRNPERGVSGAVHMGGRAVGCGPQRNRAARTEHERLCTCTGWVTCHCLVMNVGFNARAQVNYALILE